MSTRVVAINLTIARRCAGFDCKGWNPVSCQIRRSAKYLAFRDLRDMCELLKLTLTLQLSLILILTLQLYLNPADPNMTCSAVQVVSRFHTDLILKDESRNGTPEYHRRVCLNTADYHRLSLGCVISTFWMLFWIAAVLVWLPQTRL